MGWKTDFTVLGFFFTVFFTVFFTENTQFQLSLNKVPFSTCKKFAHEIIFPCLKCFFFRDPFAPLVDPCKPSQARATKVHLRCKWLTQKKHFTARKNDFILETLLPLRKVTFSEYPTHSEK